MITRRTVLGGLAATIAYPASAAEVTALVLAMDVSSSMTAQSYDLQLAGTADAFRHPEVIRAITGVSAVAIAVMMWGDEQHVTTPWTLLASPQDAFALADQIGATERPKNHLTGLGDALIAAGDLMDACPWPGWRRIVDVSGDGPSNHGAWEVTAARDRLVAQGIVVNGLPVPSSDHPRLDIYYREHVIGGPGAFVMRAEGYGDFARAIRAKLVMELS